MWAFYGREARKAHRGEVYNRQEPDVANVFKEQFSDADVHMMCKTFLKVRKADLVSRCSMDNAILAAYEKGQRAHTATNKLDSHRAHS